MAQPRRQNSLEGVPLAVLASIAGGFAGLTFFVFVGGAVTMARFRGDGLSGTKAVALVPKADLLAVGAQAMLLPTMIGLALLVPFIAVEPQRKVRRWLLAGLALAGLATGAYLINRRWPIDHWSKDEVTAMVAFALLVIAGAFGIDELAKRCESMPGVLDRASRAPAAILLFLIVVLAAGVVTYGMGYARPSAHPVAVLLAHGAGGLAGIYVAETDQRVWIGQVQEDPRNPGHGVRSKGRIIDVPRSELSAVAVGSLLSLDDALGAGPRLMDALQASGLSTIPG